MLDRDKYLSQSEVNYLRKCTKSRGSQNEWMVIDLLLSTGIRASECRHIKIGDLNFNSEPSVRVFGKGGKRRCIPFSNALKAHLKQFLRWKKAQGQGISPEDFLFISQKKGPYSLMGIQQMFKRCARRAKLRKVYSVHSCRHAFGFTVFKKSKNIRMVQVLLGHSSLSTTEIYTHVDPEEVQNVVNNLF